MNLKESGMNWMITIAGFVALFTTIGHFAVGSKSFLKPMLEASFDDIPKKVMHCVFHYVSAYLIVSTVALLLIGFGACIGTEASLLARFIAINYAVFAVWQIAIAVTSKIPNGVMKLFQWVFFVLIAVFAWLGA